MNKKRKSGFSLIEILMVMAIIILLAVIVWAAFGKLNRNQEVRGGSDIIRAVIEEARSRTLASRGDEQYGVHFETSGVTLFVGASYSSGVATNEETLLPSRVEISSIDLAGDVDDIVFERLTGAASASGDLTVSYKNDNTLYQIISVSALGLVQVNPLQSSSGGGNNFTLSAVKDGGGAGTVTSDDTNINCGGTCSANGYDGENVTLTATPSGSDTFGGWSGGGCSGTGTCQVTMSSNQTVTATFTSSGGNNFTLSAVKDGGGAGTVTSDDTNINCGGTCSANGYDGENVTLTATPSGSDTFGGWSGGGCSGTGTCQVTMSSNQTVTATFNASGPICNGTFADNFDNNGFSNSSGTLSWATNWLEIGESDGATSGDIQVRNDVSNYQLRTRDNDNGGEGVERELDLTGATSATLTYNYRRMNLDTSTDYTKVEVSANGASGPWVELVKHQGSDNDSSYQPIVHDISPYISNNTRIRFQTSPTMAGTDTVWFDDIQVQCSS